MKRQHSLIAVGTFVGALVAGLVLWSHLSAVDGAEKPKLKEKEEVIETRGEVREKPLFPEQPLKNDPKGAQIQKRQGPFTCDIRFSNYTNWWIHDVYVDGIKFGGPIAPWGDYTVYDVIVGRADLYAEADYFTDGMVRYWGPRKVDCKPNTAFTWKLYP